MQNIKKTCIFLKMSQLDQTPKNEIYRIPVYFPKVKKSQLSWSPECKIYRKRVYFWIVPIKSDFQKRDDQYIPWRLKSPTKLDSRERNIQKPCIFLKSPNYIRLPIAKYTEYQYISKRSKIPLKWESRMRNIQKTSIFLKSPNYIGLSKSK